jgi:ATP-binding cassette subfamily C protein
MNSDNTFRPFNCPVWARPVVFVVRMARLNSAMALLVAAVVVALGLVEGLGISILLPLLSRLGVDTGSREGGPARAIENVFSALGIPLTIGAVLLVFLAVGMTQIGLNAFQQYLIARSNLSLMSVLRRRLFDAASQASWTALAAGRAAHLINAVVSEVARIGAVYGDTMTALGLVFSFVVYLVLAAWLSWPLTALTALVGGISMVALRGVYRSSRRFGKYTSISTNKMQEVLHEHVNSAKLIRALGAGAWSRSTFASSVDAVSEYALRNQGNTILVKSSVEPLGLLLITVMIYLSVDVIPLSAAEIMLMLVIVFRITPRLAVLQEMLQRISGMLPAYEAVTETLGTLQAASEPQGGTPFDGLRHGIELKKVSLRHEGHTVLDGIDLTIGARTTVALVGRSGGGKTTLLDVLSGVLTPNEGEVLVDGVPLSSFNLDGYRRRIGVVPQDNAFFHDTIAANLRIAAPSATNAEMWKALEAAHANDFVRDREHGLEAIIGDQGLRLSGGQRQRLSLARALLRQPDILLLDEPTSAIDKETEVVIRDTLKLLRGKMTIVLVTHRLEMATDADVVYTVINGQVRQTIGDLEKEAT